MKTTGSVAPLVQGGDATGGDLRCLMEVELCQGLQPRQMGLFEPTGDRVALTLLEFDTQERLEVAEIALVFPLGLLSQTRELTADPG